MSFNIEDMSEAAAEAIVSKCSSPDRSSYRSFMMAGEYWAKDKFVCRGLGSSGFYCGSLSKRHFRLYVIAVACSCEGTGLASALLEDMKIRVYSSGRKKITFKTKIGSRALEWWNRRGAVLSDKGFVGDEAEMEIIL